MSQNAQIYSNTLEGNFGGIAIFPQLRLAVLGGGCEEQCGVQQHGRRRHAELRVRERLQLPLLVHLNTARAVSEWFEEPDLLPQRVPRAITLWPVHVLGRLEVLESVAGTGARCRRQPIPVAAEAGAFCRRVRRTQADAPLAFLVHPRRRQFVRQTLSVLYEPLAATKSCAAQPHPASIDHCFTTLLTSNPCARPVFPHIRRCHCGVSVGTCNTGWLALDDQRAVRCRGDHGSQPGRR